MNRKEYLLHLIGEISNYLLEREPSRLVISLHRAEDGLHLCALDSTARSDEELATMSASLNAGARPEFAEYYGHLAGADQVAGARLDLVGCQVRKAEVGRTEEGTKLDLWLVPEPPPPKPLFRRKRPS